MKREDSYNYLLSMQISSLTAERMKSLQDSIKAKKKEYDILKKKTVEQLWIEDLS